MLEAVESDLDVVIHYTVLVLEILGAVLILHRCVLAVIRLFQGNPKLCRGAFGQQIEALFRHQPEITDKNHDPSLPASLPLAQAH